MARLSSLRQDKDQAKWADEKRGFPPFLLLHGRGKKGKESDLAIATRKRSRKRKGRGRRPEHFLFSRPKGKEEGGRRRASRCGR